MARGEGLVFREGGRRVEKSAIEFILRNPIHMGDFLWNRKTYRGSHQELTSRETWGRAQEVRAMRAVSSRRRQIHEFLLSGLVTCGRCPCALVGDRTKGRYVYYPCSHNRQPCDETYIREERLLEGFGRVLDTLRFNDRVLELVRDALRQSQGDQQR